MDCKRCKELERDLRELKQELASVLLDKQYIKDNEELAKAREDLIDTQKQLMLANQKLSNYHLHGQGDDDEVTVLRRELSKTRQRLGRLLLYSCSCVQE